MVAMAITTIIVTVLVSITSIALDTWNRSRAELRASRQAKTMIDVVARDLESLVMRRGNVSEWFVAEQPTEMPGENLKSTNVSQLTFLTAATDRYDGKLGTSDDKGGDVSCVAYRLEYKDPVDPNGDFKTFVLNRFLISPFDTFKDVLGKTDMTNAIAGNGQANKHLFDATETYNDEMMKPVNFLCENVFQFTLTFHLQITQTSAGTPPTTTIVNFPLTIPSKSPQIDTLSITGGGIVLKNDNIIVTGGVNGFTREQILGGRITAVEISVTVISDFGIDQLRNRSFTGSQQAEFLAKHSYEFSKLVQLPTM